MSGRHAAAAAVAHLTHGDKLHKIGALNPARLKALETLADLVLREELARVDLEIRRALHLVKPQETHDELV